MRNWARTRAYRLDSDGEGVAAMVTPDTMTLRYLPPGSLTVYDTNFEVGLEQLLYYQALITELAET